MDEYMKQKTQCGICFLVYKNPKTLSCLHTLCENCVNKIKNNGNIICPFCSASSDTGTIRDDFNIKELVEIRLKAENQNEHDAQNQEPPTKKRLMEHHIFELGALLNENRKFADNLKTKHETISEIETTAVANSQALRQACVNSVHARFNKIDTEIAEVCLEKLENVNTALKNSDENLQKIQQEIAKARGGLAAFDASSATSGETSKTFARTILNLSEVPDVDVDTFSLEIKPARDWNIKPPADLYVVEGQQRNIIATNLYSDATGEGAAQISDRPDVQILKWRALQTKRFTLLQKRKCGYSAECTYSCHVLKDELWLCSGGRFHDTNRWASMDHGYGDYVQRGILSSYKGELKLLQQSQHINCCDNYRNPGRNLSHTHIAHIHDICELPGNKTAIATGNGLFIQQGISPKMSLTPCNHVSQGTHTSIRYYNGKIFSAATLTTSQKCNVCIFVQQEEKWELSKFIYLPENYKAGEFCTLDIWSESIYVCNVNNDVVYKLDLEGNITKEYTRTTGLRVCAHDDSGLLFASATSKNLQLLTADEQWHEFPFTVEDVPVGAVIFDGKLCVACQNLDLLMYDFK